MSIVTTNSKSRNLSLDFAKGLGMCLVVYAHFSYTEPIYTIIYSFHMPLFFIISGLLFNEKKYDSFLPFIKSKIKSLLIPYLVFVVISIILTCIINLLFGLELISWQSIIDIFLAKNSTSFIPIHNEPLWFVPCLFLIECIYYFVNKIKNNVLYIIVILSAFLIGWFLSSQESFNIFPWNARTALFALSFYATGHRIVRRYYFDGNSNFIMPKKALLAIMFSSIVVCVPIALINGKVSLGHNVVNNGLLLYITGILGSMFVLSFSELFHGIPFVIFLGENSFLIMGVHMLIGSSLHLFFQKVFFMSNYEIGQSIFLSLLFSILVLILSVLVVYIFNTIKSRIIKSWKT